MAASGMTWRDDVADEGWRYAVSVRLPGWDLADGRLADRAMAVLSAVGAAVLVALAAGFIGLCARLVIVIAGA